MVDDTDPLKERKRTHVADLQNEYQSRRFKRLLSPKRNDPFQDEYTGRGYREVMNEQRVGRETNQEQRQSDRHESSLDQTGVARPKCWQLEGALDHSEWDNLEHEKTLVLNGTPGSDEGQETPVYPSDSGKETPLRIDQCEMLEFPVQPITTAQGIENLDNILPKEGYVIIDVSALEDSGSGQPPKDVPGFEIPDSKFGGDEYGIRGIEEDVEMIKPEDIVYFGKLMNLTREKEQELDLDEILEIKLLRLLLRIKNGTPAVRRLSLRRIADRAIDFGPKLLFDSILPLLMSPTLDDRERHFLVKTIDRIMFKLDDLVRPYVHKILTVIQPLLIDENYYTRVEGREIVSNLSKAAGLATMISAMRPDLEHSDEYVRNLTARGFSVVATSLGIPSLLPFIRAVISSRKKWETRHTGIKIVQQLAILVGCGILPHLKECVELAASGLEDAQIKVRNISALSISALAEAAYPYGIDSFGNVLKPLWKGCRLHRGKTLVSFLKAIGHVIPLMEPEHANYYTREMLPTLVREFSSPDEEMKRTVLKILRQILDGDILKPQMVREDILPEYFRCFWTRRTSLDKRNYKSTVEATVDLASRVGGRDIVLHLTDHLKDESEAFRKMALEAISRIVQQCGVVEIDAQVEKQIMDGGLYVFQQQTMEDTVISEGFGAIVRGFGVRCGEYLGQIVSTVLWRLNNKSALVRQQAADMAAQLAPTLVECGEMDLLHQVSHTCYEYLGEEYPEVLGSLLGALKSVLWVVGPDRIVPPTRDFLPRLTPILKNRNEKVQENCVECVGRIADRGAEHVSPREWLRICFELLEILKAHRKSIRKAAINTFGFIAKAIGPQDVLSTLLNNLKVQERQNRVCTTIAIAIVAETCSPFTVLPALLNEYRVPELNVQNGVLKSLAFVFEYVGERTRDYVYSVLPLLEDALIERDLVHRQIACQVVKHAALGCAGHDSFDAFIHCLNLIWPNIFETSPHVTVAVLEAIEALRLVVGPGIILNYLLQGLFHPARRVRATYWRVYNNLYIGAGHALVAFYPRFDIPSLGNYAREELDLFI